MSKSYSKLSLNAIKDYFTIHTASMMIMVVVSGTFFAYSQTREFNLLLFLGTLIPCFFALLGTNALNNYSESIEFKSADERLRRYILSEKTTVVSYNINPRIVLVSGIVCYLIVIISGIFLMYNTTWYLIIPGIIGVIVGITYTNGPFPLVKLPLTEIFSGICVGGFVFNISYYVQAMQLNVLTIIMSLIVTFSVSLVNCNNHLCDVERDIISRRRTFAVFFGQKAAILQMKIFYMLIYATWIATGVLDVFGIFSLLGIFPLMIAVKYLYELGKLKEPKVGNKMHLEKYIVLHVFVNVIVIILASLLKMKLA